MGVGILGWLLAVGFVLGMLGRAAGQDRAVRSAWTEDAMAPAKGRPRLARELPRVEGALPAPGEVNRDHFREYAPGELTAEAFQLSTGSWTGLKLTWAKGRPSSAYHFVDLEASRLEPLLRSGALVSGVALGVARPARGTRVRRETVAFVVPKEEEVRLLSAFVCGPRTPERMRDLEAQAFARALARVVGSGSGVALVRR